ncbi:MAG: hypothetical protein AB7G75_21785 [Candidatus Binatia bacterium]
MGDNAIKANDVYRAGTERRFAIAAVPLTLTLVFSVFFLTFLCWYWRMDFYYYFYDDLFMLYERINIGWRHTLLNSVNEHFLPFFKLILFMYAKLFGNDVYWFHYLTVVAHGVTVLIAALLSYVLSRSLMFALLILFFYGLHPLLWEILYAQTGLGMLLSATGWLTTLLFFVLWRSREKRVYLVLSLVGLVLQSYTFGNNLFQPLLYGFLLLMYRHQVPCWVFGLVAVLQGVNLIVFFNCGSWSVAQQMQHGAHLPQIMSEAVQYFLFGAYANLGRALLFQNIVRTALASFWIWQFFLVFAVIAGLSVVASQRFPHLRPWIVLGWGQYLLVTALIALARHTLSPAQSLESRYLYLLMPGIVIILSTIWPLIPDRALTRPIVGTGLGLLLCWGLLSTTADVNAIRQRWEQRHATVYQVIQYGLHHPQLTMKTEQICPIPWEEIRKIYPWIAERAILTHRQGQPVPERLRMTEAQLAAYIAKP